MNNAQIKKLQKKVSKKLDPILENREKEEKRKEQEHFNKKVLPNLITIRNTIFDLQKSNPDNGGAFCVWEGKVYAVISNKAKIADGITPTQLANTEDMFVIKTDIDKKYYMMNAEVHKLIKEMNEWVSNNYASIRMALVRTQKNGDKGGLQEAFTLGTIGKEFTDKFPGSTLIDLVKLYKAFEKFLIEQFSEKKEN